MHNYRDHPDSECTKFIPVRLAVFDKSGRQTSRQTDKI